MRKLMDPEWVDHGACRRYPDHIRNAKEVMPDDWCGEWKENLYPDDAMDLNETSLENMLEKMRKDKK